MVVDHGYGEISGSCAVYRRGASTLGVSGVDSFWEAADMEAIQGTQADCELQNQMFGVARLCVARIGDSKGRGANDDSVAGLIKEAAGVGGDQKPEKRGCR